VSDQAVKNKEDREWLMGKVMTGCMANAILDMDNFSWSDGGGCRTDARADAWNILVEAAEEVTGKQSYQHDWEQSQKKSRFDYTP
jgi:hypothetical protein